MADNMIELVAKLDTDASERLINSQISDGSLKLDTLNIKCVLDTDSINKIKSTIGNLSKDIKLNVSPVAGAKVENLVDTKVIKSQAKELSDALSLELPRGKTQEIRDTIQQLMADYKKAFQANDGNAMVEAFNALATYVSQFRKDIQITNDDLVAMQQHIKALAREGKTFISKGDFAELKTLLDGGKNANLLLTKAFGVGNWTTDSTKATTSWDKKVQSLNDIFDVSRIGSLSGVDSGRFNDHIDGVIQLVNYLNQSFDTGDEYVKEYAKDIEQAFDTDLYNALQKILGLTNAFEGEWETVFDPNEVKETAQETQVLANELQETKREAVEVAKAIKDIEYPKSLSRGDNTDDILARAKTVIGEELASNADTAGDKVSRVKKAVEDAEGQLQSFIVQVEKENKSVETLTYSLNEQGDAYEYLGKTIREADNSTDFRRKDLSTQWSIQSEKLIQFANNADKAGFASTTLREDIQELFELLNHTNPDAGGNTSTMNAFLDKFDIAKAKLQALNAEVRRTNFAETLSNKVKKLSADMDAYAAANKRAINSTKEMSNGSTFMATWSDLTSRMAKGADLSASEIKHLGEEFRIFGKEAEAAGLKGDNAWQKFLNSFKVMSSYVTANMVFNFVKRQVQDMINEVRNLDTAMVELRKVTEATDAEFEAFQRSAGKTARELGSSISDVINATSTFSRAGFNLPDAEELGRIATLYKNVGDGINIDDASESIISVMKAFNIEASESERIIDRINNVSNNFAIDSQGLGLALQRVASAMDAANNSLDETIALTTVSNEIVQNPEMVAQGWRTVALRIRGAKSELEDAGLETEGMVESTAKLRDLIKGISGVDIMLDENTFKSTYQIIEEIGKVWNNISDVNQASLLEAIAGKRQSNIVAAALNNYERLDDVLDKSINSIGSAQAEQEEYAKSIQYSFDTLKAAYQDFADSVVDNGLVKGLLGTAQSFLEILTKIIDKFGALPTLLTGLAAFGGAKGVGKLSEYAYLRSVAI